jgi:hypothetical protein
MSFAIFKSFCKKIILPSILIFLFFPQITLANTPAVSNVTRSTLDDIIREGLIKSNIQLDCQNFGRCSTIDILQIIVNVGTVILGISGSIFLLMFVIGGFTWLMSGGEDGAIKKGLDTMRDATIGIVIVFSAYLIVNTAISVIALGRLPTTNLEKTINQVIDGGSSVIQTQ